MLPVEKLDKKSYSEILQDSVSNIKRFTDEWTDLSSHDPGITMLEMLSWLTDMQRYYLNRITQKNVLKYLKLYGVELKGQTKARSYVELKYTGDNTILPRGTKLRADEQIFETTQTATLTSNSVKKAVSTTEYLETDNTYVLLNKKLLIYPFDKQIKDGNKLYIAFEKELKVGSYINIYFDVVDDYAIKLNDCEQIKYHIDFSWMSISEKGERLKIDVVKDETQSFTKKGNVTIKIVNQMSKYDFFNNGEAEYWICIEANNVGANLSPKIKNIALNYVPIENKNTYVYYEDFENKSQNRFYDDIFIHGKIVVQYKNDDKYVDIDEELYTIERNIKDKYIQISNVDKKYNKLRIIGFAESPYYKTYIGTTNGLPYQQFYFPLKNVVPEEFVLQVAEYKNGVKYWNDYHYVKNFSLAIEDKRVFTLDEANQQIIFGDNESTIAPTGYTGMENPLSSQKDDMIEPNVRVLNLVLSDKERGNIKSNEIKSFVNQYEDIEHISITYSDKASGGHSGMSINDGEKELVKDSNNIYRAVTTTDYEQIAKLTPGLRILFAKANLSEKEENTINIVVVPYDETRFPKPDEKMIRIIRANVEKYRMITTNVNVVSPKYVGINLTAAINIDASNKFNQRELKNKLIEFLTPINSNKINMEYIVGQKVYLSDIIEIINSFDNVRGIDYIRMDYVGEGARRDKEGNIILPDNGICYADTVDINIY